MYTILLARRAPPTFCYRHTLFRLLQQRAFVVKVKGIVIPEMRGGNRLEQDFPNKSSYIKYVE